MLACLRSDFDRPATTWQQLIHQYSHATPINIDNCYNGAAAAKTCLQHALVAAGFGDAKYKGDAYLEDDFTDDFMAPETSFIPGRSNMKKVDCSQGGWLCFTDGITSVRTGCDEFAAESLKKLYRKGFNQVASNK